MNLSEQIKEDLKTAMRAKEALAVEVLRGAISAGTNELVAKGKKPTDVLSDEEYIAVIKRMVKQRKDSFEQFMKGNRPDLAQKEEKEIPILEKYVPAKASREEIHAVAIRIVSALPEKPKNPGALIGQVRKELPHADGADIKSVLDDLLK